MPKVPTKPAAPVSVSDVARLAEVSPATVSRAFNNPGLLGAPTLERVQRAAKQLGYQPYGLARSLRSRRSMVVGIVMPSLRYAYYSGTLELLQSLLAREGYTLLLSSSNHDPQIELEGVRALMSQGVDGVILFGRPLNDEERPLLAQRGVPHIRCWAALPNEASVAFDHSAAMADVVEHLVALGHRQFAMVMPFVALGDRFRGRLTAIRETLAKHGLAIANDAIVDDGGLDAEAGRLAYQTLQARGVQATAVICSNDLIAAGVILACQACGLQVPADVSVTGYNDSGLARAFEPAITSVDTPVDVHAQEVARVMLAVLRREAPRPDDQAAHPPSGAPKHWASTTKAVSRKIFANENSGLAVLEIIDATFIQVHTGNAHMGFVNNDNAVIYKNLNFKQIEEDVENARGVTA